MHEYGIQETELPTSVISPNSLKTRKCDERVERASASKQGKPTVLRATLQPPGMVEGPASQPFALPEAMRGRDRVV
jgi:hypothetical protein